ncbi:MAG: sugar phosphate nucleotidyltransferase [Nannocystaceae bacterium]
MHAPELKEGWALVLAAGEGSRLASLTQAATGDPVPKQFCAFGGEVSLLERTLDRAAAIVDPRRIVTVVHRAHRRWWGPLFADVARSSVIVQPSNRGTAIGILLPLLAIARRDPGAVVVILPTDHYVGDEGALRATIAAAFRHAGDDGVILLGITPEGPETSYGYIVPELGSAGRPHRVRRFVEKPAIAAARRLLDEGALWSSFLFVGRVGAYIDLIREALPGLVDALAPLVSAADEGAPIDALYASTPSRDFSRDVLERGVDRLRVLAVPRCGWVDLGEPERLLRTLPRLRRAEARTGTLG